MRRVGLAVPFVVAASVSSLCACRESADVTQTIVWLEADEDARDAIALIRVRADGPSDDPAPRAETRDPKWPVKVVLAPQHGDASRRFTLLIDAMDAEGDRRMTLQFATGFVANKSRYVKLMIGADCVRAKATCGADEVCNVWSLERSANEFGSSADDPRIVTAMCDAKDPSEPGTMAGTGGAGGANPAAGAGAGGVGGSGAGAGSGGAAGGGGGSPCATGYVTSGTGCSDIDECASGKPCGDHGKCENLPGDYICECDSGYQSRAGSCVPAGDCQMNNGGCETSCDNATGFAVCGCGAGEWLKADRKACGAFAPPERVDRASSIAPTQPHFAFDAAGNGLALWIYTSGTPDAPEASLWARRYVAGQGWEAQVERIDSDEGSASAPRVALAPNGRGVVVWIQTSGGDGDVWAVEYHDGEFGDPSRIDAENTGSTTDPQVQLDSNGDGFASWMQTDGTQAKIWVNRFSGEDGWQDAQAIETPARSAPPAGMNGNVNWMGPGSWGNWGNWADWGDSGGAFGARIAVDSEGSASLVWTQIQFGEMGGVAASPWSSRFDSMSEKWKGPMPLDEGGASGMPDAQLFGKGHGLAVWARNTAGRVSIRASSQMPNGKWNDSVNIATVDSDLTAVVPRVALSPLGRGAAIWAQYETPNLQVWANRYDGSSDTWSGAVQLSTVESPNTPLPQIAVDPSGDGFGVWSEVKGTSREIKVARLQSDTGFVGTAVLAADATTNPPSNSPVQIAVDPDGRALAIWDSFEMGQYRVRASTFD